MDKIKKIFPVAFAKKADATALIVNIIIHLAIWLVCYAICTVLTFFVPVVSVILGLLFDIVKLYLGASIILSVLDYLKVFKD